MTRFDKFFKAIANRCDICQEPITAVTDRIGDLVHRMKIIEEIDDSYQSEADKSTHLLGPKLLLCNWCEREYLIPKYI